MDLSTCGLVCSDCQFYRTNCPGCRESQGRPFWVEEVKEKRCSLYGCCMEKGLSSCGDCGDLPCSPFLELKDPNLSDEEHRLELERRVKRLKGEI